MIDHSLQAVVVDSLAVGSRHRSIDVAHDGVDSHLVSAGPGDGFKGVAEGVERQAGALQVQPPEQFNELLSYRISC